MSCCTIEKKEESSKNIATLKKLFDEVVLEDLKEYRLLTLRDKCNRENYDYVVYLSVKVSYAVNSGNYNYRSDEEMLNGILKQLVHWADMLKEDEKPKQLSLFGEEELELESEPDSPQGGDDNNWAKYFRDCENVRKRNLKKQYSFFELCDLNHSWYCYNDNTFAKFLPQTDKEMIEYIRENINDGFRESADSNIRNTTLSDIELYERVRCSLRLDLLPYKSHSYVSVDDSFSAIKFENEIRHRYDFNYLEMSGSWNYNELPKYNLYRPDFIQLMREHFNCKFRENFSDDEVLDKNIVRLFEYILDKEEKSLQDYVDESANAKELKKKLKAFEGSTTMSCTGISVDGFRSNFDFGKKLSIKITQDVDKREKTGRSTEGFRADYRDDLLVIWDIKSDEIYQRAFKLLKKVVVEKTLFDFAA